VETKSSQERTTHKRAYFRRLTLALAGVEFEDCRIKFPDWKEIKPTTPYGQVPILEIDGQVRTQSMAMVRWAGHTYAPDTLYPVSRIFDIEEALGVVDDAKTSFQPCFRLGMRPASFGYPEDYSKTDEGKAKIKELREQWVKDELPKRLGFLKSLLDKSNGKWLASSDEPTVVDCVAIPFLRSLTRGIIDFVPADCLSVEPAIEDYVKRFCALEAIKGRYKDGLF